MKDDQLKYPDDIVLLWNHTHYSAETASRADECGIIWEKLYLSLANMLKKSNIPGIKNNEMEAQDAAIDFISHLLTGVCPEHIARESILVSECRKFLAKKRNPVQYELNDILHTALLALETQKLIERENAGKKKRISGTIKFALSGTEPSALGSWEKYQEKSSEIPRYVTICRNNDWEHTRILTPENANDLVLKLLQAFGGWTPAQDLLRAMMNHIPDQFILEKNESIDTEDSRKDDTKFADKDGGNYVFEHETQQSYMIGIESADHIWKQICNVSQKVFCLLSLPKYYYQKDVTLQEVGKTSTVDDQNKKIMRILEEELKELKICFSATAHERTVIFGIIQKIFCFLTDRCTENGYSSDLYCNENEERIDYEEL